MGGVARYLICWNDKGTIGAVIFLLLLLQGLQLDVHAGGGHHVYVLDEGLVGLTTILGKIFQQILRVGIAFSPGKHFLGSDIQEKLENLLGLIKVNIAHRHVQSLLI